MKFGYLLTTYSCFKFGCKGNQLKRLFNVSSKNIFLISGQNPKDIQISEDIKRAVKKFGAKIVKEKVWDNNSDIRRRATEELPSFTQASDYDVIVVADYFGDFGELLYFNTWFPRPIAGTQGLTPVTWHKVIESNGAAQMQSRFESFASVKLFKIFNIIEKN